MITPFHSLQLGTTSPHQTIDAMWHGMAWQCMAWDDVVVDMAWELVLAWHGSWHGMLNSVAWCSGGMAVCTFQSPPNSCRTSQDSAGLQAKVLILLASPAELGRVWQSLEELGRT